MRLTLAKIYTEQPHLLILDEPTNHLDIESVEALIAAVCEFKGGVVCVTHNLHFIERCGLSVYELKNKHLEETTLTKYVEEILKDD